MNIKGCHLISEPVGVSASVGQTDGFETTVWFKWPNWELQDFTPLANPIKLGVFGTVNQAVRFAHSYVPRMPVPSDTPKTDALSPGTSVPAGDETVPKIEVPS